MKLEDMRKRIDEIDQDLVKLLELRFQVVKEIGQYKKEHNLPILDEVREKAVLASKKALVQNKQDWPHFEKVFQKIMDVAKDLET